MKRAFWASAVLLVLTACACEPARASSFDREYERYNRERSFRVLDRLDQDIQIRVEESEKEKMTEEEQLKQAEEAAKQEAKAPQGPGWSIRTSGAVQLTRISNTFERRNNAVGETTMAYSPGIKAATRVLDAWNYKSDYRMAYYQNKNFHFNDRLEHEWVQVLSRRGSKLMVSMENTLSFFKFQTESHEDELSPAKANELSADITYRMFPRLTLVGYYSNQYIDFKNTALKTGNTLNDAFGGRILWQWSPKVDVFADHSYRFSRPPKQDELSDINAQNFTVGISGIIAPKLAVSMGVGIDSQEFAATDDKLGSSATGAVRYTLSPKTSFSLRYQRDTVPTAEESATDPLNHVVDFGITYRFSPKITLAAGQTVRFIQDATESTVTDPENPLITTTKRDESVRLNSRLGASIRPTRSLSIDAEYIFERVVSELQVSDSTNHIASIEVSKQF